MNKLLQESPLRYFALAALAAYAATGMAAYWEVLNYGTFLFDDYDYVLNNGFSQESLWANLFDSRFVAYATFRFNEVYGGNSNPFGYHLFNLSVHVLNALLVFSLVYQLLSRLSDGREEGGYDRAVSLLAGLIFVAHPLATQSVSYITQRFTSLCTFFYLAAVTLYLFARTGMEMRRQPLLKWCAYGGAWGATLLAFKTKEISFTIPVMILFLEMSLFRCSRLGRKRFLLAIPFAAAMLVIPLSILGPELGLVKRGEGVAEIVRQEKVFDLKNRDILQYLLTQFRAIVIYVRLLVFPVNQAVIYDLKPSKSVFEPVVLGSLGVIISVMLAGAWAAVKGYYSDGERARCFKLMSFGVVWFFITISVESSIIPIKDLVFEHRTYLPSVGVYAAFAGLLVQLLRHSAKPEDFALEFWIVALAAAVSLGSLTYMRNGIWTDELAFWDDAVQSAPEKPIAYHNRAFAFHKRGMFPQALKDFDKAISYFPSASKFNIDYERGDLSPYNMSKAYENRANTLKVMGYEQLAEEDFRRSQSILRLEEMPDGSSVSERIFMEGNSVDSSDPYVRGKEMLRKGKAEEAVRIFTEILGKKPDDAFALVSRGNAYSALKRFPDAMSDYDLAAKLKPNLAAAYHNRGLARVAMGNRAEGIRDINKACGFGVKDSCDLVNAIERGYKLPGSEESAVADRKRGGPRE